MLRKIYGSMRLLIILTLSLVTSLLLAVFCACLTQQAQNNLAEKTELIFESAVFEDLTDSHFSGCRVAVISKSGGTVYSNDFPEYYLEHYAEDFNRSNDFEVFSKFVFSECKRVYFCTAQLPDGNLLCTVDNRRGVSALFAVGTLGALLTAALVGTIAASVAKAAARSIVAPFSEAVLMNYADTGDMYEEIKPLIAKLTNQDSEIKRQSDKARSQKLQLKTVTSNMNEGLIILDRACNVLSMNRCAQDILKTEERDVKYKSFLNVPGSNRLEAGLKAASAGKNSDLLFESSAKTYQMFFTPVFENDMVCGIVILLFDVSEKHRAEQIRREFSANVSHELKTPLTTIFGYSQIITNGIAKPEDVKGFAAKIEKESSRLIHLIDDIIALSNLEENGAEAHKEQISLKSVVNDVFESLEAQASKRGITLNLSGGDTLVTANLRQMNELLFNLCDNAVKYNKDGGTVTVTLSSSMVCVADTGIGIPPDSIDRLFERFYRVDKSHSKKVNGTGLGLSIVKHIVQNNNAEISVKSTLGEGSVFTVEFRA